MNYVTKGAEKTNGLYRDPTTKVWTTNFSRFLVDKWQVTKELEIGIGHFAVFTYSQLSVNCIEMIFPLISLFLVVTSHQRNGNQTGISRFDQLSVNCIEIILLHGYIIELVSKELYHLAAILQYSAWSLIFMK